MQITKWLLATMMVNLNKSSQSRKCSTASKPRDLSLGFLQALTFALVWTHLATVSPAIGATDHHAATSPAEHSTHTTQPDPHPHPAIADDATWVRPMIAAIAAVFIAAIPVGLVVRANMPQQLPATHSHDEPPGATGHDAHDSHGTGGRH